MFNWFYKRIADGVGSQIDKDVLKGLLIETLNDDETQKVILEFTDSLYARYAQKVMGTIGRSQQLTASDGGVKMPAILNSKGQLNLKGLIPMFLSGAFGNQGERQGGLP